MRDGFGPLGTARDTCHLAFVLSKPDFSDCILLYPVLSYLFQSYHIGFPPSYLKKLFFIQEADGVFYFDERGKQKRERREAKFVILFFSLPLYFNLLGIFLAMTPGLLLETCIIVVPK